MLKTLPIHERPRERLQHFGAEALSSIELLAILLSSGTKKRSVLQLAADLLSEFGSLEKLSKATLAELKKVKGIGPAKAVQLKATFALWSRFQHAEWIQRIDSPEAVYQELQGAMQSLLVEELWVILRDVRRRLVHKERLFKGTLTELLLHPREIFSTAIAHRAHSVIIAHNHPSGDSSPSQKDIEMTHILISAGRILGISLSDHLVLGKNSFTSLYQLGVFAKREDY